MLKPDSNTLRDSLYRAIAPYWKWSAEGGVNYRFMGHLFSIRLIEYPMPHNDEYSLRYRGPNSWAFIFSRDNYSDLHANLLGGL